MKYSVGYIVARGMLATIPRGVDWDETTSPLDPRCLLVVHWENPTLELAFEAQAGVTLIGQPWESVSPEVADFLALFQDPQTTTMALANVGTLTPAAVETVYSTLRKVNWPIARCIR
jgi:hypothetical protein